jgi:hypothetical protein
MDPAASTIPTPSFGRRFVRGLFGTTTLVSIGLSAALLRVVHGSHWGLEGPIVGGTWLLVGLLDALGQGERGRRGRAHRLAQEQAWAAAGKRPWWMSAYKVGLPFFLLCALGFFAIAINADRDAKALARVPACTAGGPSDCIGSRRGMIVSRSVDRSQQSIVVDFGVSLKTIHLSSDGWGGKWRGHFPIGETVTVRIHRQTPLLVTEPNGHHRKTADDPSDTSGVFWFMGWFFTALALPAAYLLQRWGRALSAAVLVRGSIASA